MQHSAGQQVSRGEVGIDHVPVLDVGVAVGADPHQRGTLREGEQVEHRSALLLPLANGKQPERGRTHAVQCVVVAIYFDDGGIRVGDGPIVESGNRKARPAEDQHGGKVKPVQLSLSVQGGTVQSKAGAGGHASVDVDGVELAGNCGLDDNAPLGEVTISGGEVVDPQFVRASVDGQREYVLEN